MCIRNSILCGRKGKDKKMKGMMERMKCILIYVE